MVVISVVRCRGYPILEVRCNYWMDVQSCTGVRLLRHGVTLDTLMRGLVTRNTVTHGVHIPIYMHVLYIYIKERERERERDIYKK
jgi:hypothetical protein